MNWLYDNTGLFRLLAILLLTSFGQLAYAAEPPTACERKLLKASAKLSKCHLVRRAKGLEREKCDTRFQRAYDRAVARFGAANCPSDPGELLGQEVDNVILDQTSAYARQVASVVSGCSQGDCLECTFANFPSAPHGNDNSCFTFDSPKGYCCVLSQSFWGKPGGDPNDGCQFSGNFPSGCWDAPNCKTGSVCAVPQTPPAPPSPTTVQFKNYTNATAWVTFRFTESSAYQLSDLKTNNPSLCVNSSPTPETGCQVKLSEFKSGADNCPSGACVEISNPQKTQMNLIAAFFTSQPAVFPTCGATQAEANVNNGDSNVADISVNDGYNAVLQIKHVGSSGTSSLVAGPNTKGPYGNSKIRGVFPYGCDDCAPHSAPPAGAFNPGNGLFACSGPNTPPGVHPCDGPTCTCPPPSERVCKGTTCVCADKCHDCPSGQYKEDGSCTVNPSPVCQVQFDASTVDGVAEIGVKDF